MVFRLETTTPTERKSESRRMDAHRLIPESPQHDELRGFLAQLYGELITRPYPPMDVIGRFLRTRAKVSGSPGRFLAASASAMLRARIRLLTQFQWAGRSEPAFEWPEPQAVPDAVSPEDEPRIAMVRWLMEDCGAGADDALRLVNAAFEAVGEKCPEENADLAEFAARLEKDADLSNAPPVVRESAEWSIARDLVERWTKRFGAAEARGLFESMGRPAPLDIRVNRLKTKRRHVIGALNDNHVPCEASQWSRDGVRVLKKANLHPLTAYAEGWFEVQDEGSQLVSLAVGPQPGWRVLDACAGGGGKALHLAGLMRNRGEIFAHDASAERMEGLRKRLGRAAASCIRLVEPGHAADQGPYDAVLIDAPCLGFGTLRRSPELMLRGALQQRMNEATALQRECIKTYAPLVSEGGVLVYAVCSFEAEETFAHLRIIEDMGFQPSSLNHVPVFPRALSRRHDVTLLPTRHQTDGFLIARFVRMS